MSNIFDIFKSLEKKRDPVGGAPTYIIAGLGNPGGKYLGTRHNAGFLALDYICGQLGVKPTRAAHRALVCEAELSGARVLLMKPQTFMNESGISVGAAAKYYKIPVERVVVISDDVTLAPGRVRVRRCGSDGGHNGLKSIAAHLSSADYPRIKIGVGERPHPDYDIIDWVLGTPSVPDREAITETFPRVLEGVKLICAGDIDGAMSCCNGQ